MKTNVGTGGLDEAPLVFVVTVEPRRRILTAEDTTPGWEDLVADFEDEADE